MWIWGKLSYLLCRRRRCYTQHRAHAEVGKWDWGNLHTEGNKDIQQFHVISKDIFPPFSSHLSLSTQDSVPCWVFPQVKSWLLIPAELESRRVSPSIALYHLLLFFVTGIARCAREQPRQWQDDPVAGCAHLTTATAPVLPSPNLERCVLSFEATKSSPITSVHLWKDTFWFPKDLPTGLLCI